MKMSCDYCGSKDFVKINSHKIFMNSNLKLQKLNSCEMCMKAIRAMCNKIEGWNCDSPLYLAAN